MRAAFGPLAVTLAGLLFAGAAVGEGLRPGMSWDIQLQAPLDLAVPVAALDLDPDEVTAAEVAALAARGVTTLCYVSVGTVEDWRADAGNFPAASIGKAYEDWPGERFLDIRDPALLPIMRARFERCAAMGFAAVDPDNIDLHINDTGFPLGPGDVVRYLAALADIAHGLGLGIGQKNAGDLTGALAPLVDFAVTENCLHDGWCAQMAPLIRQGKPVLAVEYRPVGPAACEGAAAAGLSVVVKDRRLTAGGGDCR